MQDLPSTSLAEHLRTLGGEAFSAFEEQGIPTRRLEAWKGTNLAPLEAMDFARIGPRSDFSFAETEFQCGIWISV